MEPLNKDEIAAIEAELAATERTIINLKGKHIKSILSRLESISALNKEVRKIVLDEINDLTREILRELGYDVPD